MKSKYVCNIHGDTIVQTDEQAAETGLEKGACTVTLDYEIYKDKANKLNDIVLAQSPDGAPYSLRDINGKKAFYCRSNSHSVDYYVPVEHSGQFEHHDAITHEERNTTYPTAITLKATNACSCGHEQDEDTTSTGNHNWQTKETGYYTYSRDVTLEDCIDAEKTAACTTVIKHYNVPVYDEEGDYWYLGISKETVNNGTHYDYNKYNAAVTATLKTAKYCPICGMWSVD